MPAIKVQRDTKIILSLNESEAAHLDAFLRAANSPRNDILREIEYSLCAARRNKEPGVFYKFNRDSEYFELAE